MDRRLPRPALLTASAAGPNGPPPATIAFPGPELVSTKLVPPTPRPGLITRPGLLSLLQAGLDAKLCLVDAPAGSGKTILLAQWRATSGAGRVAWVSLDEGDNDPIRLWMLIGQALQSIEPAVGAAALRALQRTSVDLERMVLPSLLNDLSRIAAPLVLVLDDYHLIANRACHQAMTFFLDHLPASIHLLLATRGRDDPSAFIAAFSGDNRHVADYLTADVLARQPEKIRTFLLRTSILRRLSGPLCDHVLETEGSAELLGELERSNLFLLALDDRRRWHRYHHLFGQLLRLELGNHEPALVPALHRRAAAWHRRHGDVEETIHHVTAAGEFAEAGALIARHWLGSWRRGRGATVSRWLQGLPAKAIAADPPVAFVAAWIGGTSGASKQETERWLAAVEDDRWRGTLPEGISSLAFGAALARAAVLFDDVGRARQAAHRALELAGPEPSPFHWMAQAVLGQALYLSGQPAGARPPLEELIRRVSAAEQPYAVVAALALLSLLAGDEDNHAEAEALAHRAAEAATAQGLTAVPLSGIAHVALGRALLRAGRLAEAQERLEWALELHQIDGMAVHRAHTLLLLAAARHGQGDLAGARTLRDRAHQLIEELADPGMLPALLQRTRRTPGPAPRQARHPPRSPRESWRSCGCCPPGCPRGRSATSSTCRSIRSGARSGRSTGSSGPQAGLRPSPRRGSSACFHVDEKGDGGCHLMHLRMTMGVMKRQRWSDATAATVYRIVIRGELSARYGPAFEGMTLATGDGQTAITGPVIDQAHLHGLLNRIGDLGLELISINPTLEPAAPARARRTGEG